MLVTSRFTLRKVVFALIVAALLLTSTVFGLRLRRDLALKWRDQHAAILSDRLKNPGEKALDPVFRKGLDHHARLVSKWDDVVKHPWKPTWPDPAEPR